MEDVRNRILCYEPWICRLQVSLQNFSNNVRETEQSEMIACLKNELAEIFT